MATLSQFSHPSLGLGNIAQPEVVEILDKINLCEAKIDAAHDKVNAAIMFKRSITMTLNELENTEIDKSSVSEKIGQIKRMISDAANEYIQIKIENEESIARLKTLLSNAPSTQTPESPINMDQSKLLSQPLFSESLKLDSQYFSFSSNLNEDKLAGVEKFIRSSTSNIANKSDELNQSVCAQISDQIENHNICGTLIITASCTHRNVQIFSPLIIDADKAINAWNSMKPDKIKTSDMQSVHKIMSDTSDSYLPLITGAAYGSSFIGMAHILQSETSTLGDLDKLKAQLDKKLKAGGWLANATGEIGVDQSLIDEVRAFLSVNSISCHISIVSMGAIPTIKSNELTTSAYKLADIDTKSITKLGDISPSSSISSEAETARQQALVCTMQNARIKNILSTVSKTDDTKNNILDIKTLIEALDNYITTIGTTDKVVGIPIHFFIRRLTKSDIAKIWLNQYYPDQ